MDSNGNSYTNPWRQEGSTWSAYCPMPSSGNTATRQIILNHKVRDSSGMESAISSYTLYCAIR